MLLRARGTGGGVVWYAVCLLCKGCSKNVFYFQITNPWRRNRSILLTLSQVSVVKVVVLHVEELENHLTKQYYYCTKKKSFSRYFGA